MSLVTTFHGKKSTIFQICQTEILSFIVKCVNLENDIDPSKRKTRKAATDPASLLGLSGTLNEANYAFVEKIKSQIEAELGDLIEEQLAGQRTEGGRSVRLTGVDGTVPILVDQILISERYLSLVERLKKDAKESAAEIMKQMQKSTVAIPTTPKPDASFSAHSATTMESCSLGSLASGICPKDDELPLLLVQLHPCEEYPVRLQAAKVLASFSVGDLLADEFWPMTKDVLQLAMQDVDLEYAVLPLTGSISQIALEIYSRSFKLAPAYMIPELYTSYANQVVLLMEKSRVPVSETGIDPLDPSTNQLLKQFRLLNQFMAHLPQYWVRFTEPVSKEIIRATGLLLGAKSPGSYLTAVHLLAIVDPQSLWIDKWTVSQ
ncbi:hypothetical protein HDU91_001694, partial [Kappamyces sp. JEL0680]